MLTVNEQEEKTVADKVRTEGELSDSLTEWLKKISREIRPGSIKTELTRAEREELKDIVSQEYWEELSRWHDADPTEYDGEDPLLESLPPVAAAMLASHLPDVKGESVDDALRYSYNDAAAEEGGYSSQVQRADFIQRIPGVVGLISVTETNWIVETVKGVNLNTGRALWGLPTEDYPELPDPLPADERDEGMLVGFPAAGLGLMISKTWRSLGDSKVRSSHRAISGTSVGMMMPFSLPGGQLMRPGDSSLGVSISEIANCRCALIIGGD